VRWPIAPIVLCLLLLGACGDSTVTESQLSGRYEADTTVLDAGEGPALCLGGIATSLPPRCGGVPVLGWDWSEVSGEQRRGGVTWGEYHVEGTYDGTTFTLLEAGPPQPRPEEPGDLFAAPCPEPEGGWVDTDPSSTKDSDRTAAMGVAEAIDSYAGLWIDYLKDPIDEQKPGSYILVVGFTDDPQLHEAAIREVWGGPLCLTSFEYTFEELRRAQHDLGNGGAERFGIQMLSSGIDVMDNRVDVEAVVFDPSMQTALDQEYVPGMVHVEPALQPM